jgi:hypothetical protein
MGDRAMLGAEVKRREMEADFTGPPPSAVDLAIAATVLHHFRDLSEVAPDREWYSSLISVIREGRPNDILLEKRVRPHLEGESRHLLFQEALCVRS